MALVLASRGRRRYKNFNRAGSFRWRMVQAAALVSTCNSTCAGGVATDYSIFEDLHGDAPVSRMAW